MELLEGICSFRTHRVNSLSSRKEKATTNDELEDGCSRDFPSLPIFTTFSQVRPVQRIFKRIWITFSIFKVRLSCDKVMSLLRWSGTLFFVRSFHYSFHYTFHYSFKLKHTHTKHRFPNIRLLALVDTHVLNGFLSSTKSHPDGTPKKFTFSTEDVSKGVKRKSSTGIFRDGKR